MQVARGKPNMAGYKLQESMHQNSIFLAFPVARYKSEHHVVSNMRQCNSIALLPSAQHWEMQGLLQHVEGAYASARG